MLNINDLINNKLSSKFHTEEEIDYISMLPEVDDEFGQVGNNLDSLISNQLHFVHEEYVLSM